MAHKKYLLGLDLGSSSVKASLVITDSGAVAASCFEPQTEMPIDSPHPGWAEQDPHRWWEHTVKAIKNLLAQVPDASTEIEAIGISYQMHGLVMFGSGGKVLRPSIIWCDSRAISAGEAITGDIGEDYSFNHLWNLPGNFTAAKLRWVMDNEPGVFEQCEQFGLPGDYIAYKLSGEIGTTASGLSEGIFWDMEDWTISQSVMNSVNANSLVPQITPSFGLQSEVTSQAAQELGIEAGIPITYRAGDQPNNAISLKVTEPGQVAATAGTSGVVYAVTGEKASDPQSRVNTFVHPNPAGDTRYGVLLCVNGSGIANSWIRELTTANGYQEMNDLAAQVPAGSDGLRMYPFGNGAERMLGNAESSATITGLQFNRHGKAHMYRAVQEGVIFALKYGFDVLSELQCTAEVIRAADANMFLSPLFSQLFSTITGSRLEIYDTDGAKGAALASGVGRGIYRDMQQVPLGMLRSFEPEANSDYSQIYSHWKNNLTT